MLVIQPATPQDIPEILRITQAAFVLYQNALGAPSRVAALEETADEVLSDLQNHHVLVAKQNGVLLGVVRYSLISPDLAYLYRFAVCATAQSGTGIKLLDYVIEDCAKKGLTALTLHTNAKYFRLARYYYNKEFFIHSTDSAKGYIRALFVKELQQNTPYDLSPAFEK